MCPAYRYVASSSKAVLRSRRDRTACRHKMASRTRRLIMVVRRSGVYRSGGWKARRAFRSCLRSFPRHRHGVRERLGWLDRRQDLGDGLGELGA